MERIVAKETYNLCCRIPNVSKRTILSRKLYFCLLIWIFPLFFTCKLYYGYFLYCLHVNYIVLRWVYEEFEYCASSMYLCERSPNLPDQVLRSPLLIRVSRIVYQIKANLSIYKLLIDFGLELSNISVVQAVLTDSLS